MDVNIIGNWSRC